MTHEERLQFAEDRDSSIAQHLKALGWGGATIASLVHATRNEPEFWTSKAARTRQIRAGLQRLERQGWAIRIGHKTDRPIRWAHKDTRS